MTHLIPTERVYPDASGDNLSGAVRWSPRQSLWTFGHRGLGLIGMVFYGSWNAVAIFVVLTGVTVCAGHCVGMHRLLIHRSFRTFKPLEYLLVWLGVLVGMAGPLGTIRQHDMRDWYQRQATCPAHARHGAGFWRDGRWQMHCTFVLTHPPRLNIEPEVADDPVYRWMERWWRWQLVPLALALFWAGGT